MKKFIALLLVGVMTFSMTACGSSAPASSEAAPAESEAAEESTEESTEEGGDAKYSILFMPKLTNIPYFQYANDGAQAVAEELGIEVIYDGPTEADAAAQVTMLENYIAQGVDAIVVGPNDPESVTSVLQKAKDAGIVILDWDTQADPSVTDGSVFQVNDTKFGEHMVDKLVEYMGTDTGDIAIITGGLEAANLNAWIDAGKAHMEKNYPGLNIVTIEPSNESQDEAYQDTKDVLTAYPDVIGILGYSSPTGPGCGKAIADLGLQDKVALVANGIEGDCQDALKSGGLKCACLWDVPNLGRLSIAAAYYMLENDGAFPENGATIEGWDRPVITDGEHIIYMTEGGDDFTA